LRKEGQRCPISTSRLWWTLFWFSSLYSWSLRRSFSRASTWTCPRLRARTSLPKKLAAISKLNPNVFLKADKDVPYGLVVQVMGEIKEAGIEKLGMITEPRITLR
jgi:hypothetical protein